MRDRLQHAVVVALSVVVTPVLLATTVSVIFAAGSLAVVRTWLKK